MTSLTTPPRREHLEQPISTDVSPTRGLLDRDGLLHLLDRAVTRRVTVISAPPGSGKTSLLRAWADRSSQPSSRRVRVSRARSTGCAAVLVRRPRRDPQPGALDRSCDATGPARCARRRPGGRQSPVGGRRASRARRAGHRRSPRAAVSGGTDAARAVARDPAGLGAPGAVVSPGSADQAAPAQACRRGRRDPSRRSPVHRARDARAARRVRASVCPTPEWPPCTSARKAGRPACASR